MQTKGFFVEHPMNILLHSPEHQNTVSGFECPRCLAAWKQKTMRRELVKGFRGTPRQILDEYREHVYAAHSEELIDCGCCGGSHFPEFNGDCREDFERF